MENLNYTEFDVPEKVVFSFIKESKSFCKRCPIEPKGDKDKCIKESQKLIHHFTYLKFHPYTDHRSGLNSVKDIKEIDFSEAVNEKEVIIVTKKSKHYSCLRIQIST